MASQNSEIIPRPVEKAFAGRDLTIGIGVTDGFARVIYARLYFRQPGSNDFRFVGMIKEGDSYIGTIPATFVTGPVVQYFFVVLFDNNEVLTFPQFEPYTKPEELTVEKASGLPASSRSQTRSTGPMRSAPQTTQTLTPRSGASTSGNILILSPEPGATLRAEDVVIAVSFFGLANGVDSTSMALFVDEVNVSRMAQTSAVLVSYTTSQLKPGRHSVRLTARDRMGNPVGPVVWDFQVLRSEDSKSLTAARRSQFSARVFSDLRHESVSGYSQDLLMAGGNFSGQYGAVHYSGRATFSSLESEQAQPRNRYQLSLTMPWIGISFGDNYPRFNNLMLWGKRLRGIESYIHLGFINLDFAMGQTYRAIEGDSVKKRFGTFQQDVIAIRPSIGGGKHFQLGITLVKAKDDTNSIQFGYAPRDNLVIGPDLLLAFDRQRIEFRVFTAFSLLTNNTRGGPITREEIEDAVGSSLPFDPAVFEKYLIINDSMQPIDPTQLTSTAYDAQLQLRYFSNTLRFGYKQIGSEYQSLAHPYLRKDIKGVYFSDRLRLFRNRVYLQFGYENYDDNFSRTDGHPVTRLSVMEYSVGLYPGVTYPRLYFHLRNYIRDNQVTGLDESVIYDEYTGDYVEIPVDRRENNLNQDLSLQIAYNVTALQARHDISLGYLTSNRIDRRTSLLISTLNPSSDLSAIMQMISVRSLFEQLPLTTDLSFASNRNDALGGASRLKYTLFNLGAEYTLFSKVSIFGDFHLSSASGTTEMIAFTNGAANKSTFSQDYTRTLFRMGGLYRLSSTHTLLLDWNIVRFADSGINSQGNKNPSFTDNMIRFRYEKRFN